MSNKSGKEINQSGQWGGRKLRGSTVLKVKRGKSFKKSIVTTFKCVFSRLMSKTGLPELEAVRTSGKNLNL